jgi:hypothetical protein
MSAQPGRRGTELLIAGAALAITGSISESALVFQLARYDPPCEPVAAWSFVGACGVLRILVLLMIPILGAGAGLLVAGLVRRGGGRRKRPTRGT